MFFDNAQSLLQVVLTTSILYGALVVLLRVTGKRTTSKMNSFDWIVTVAVGSMVATAALSPSVSIVEGVAGIGLLVFFQFLASTLAIRFEPLRQALIASPTLVFFRGQYLQQPMNHQRVTTEDILSAMRSQGITDPDQVYAVVLESNADLSVLANGPDRQADTSAVLKNVEGIPRD